MNLFWREYLLFFHDGSLIHSVIYSLTFWVVVVAVVRDVSFETVFDPESEPPPPLSPLLYPCCIQNGRGWFCFLYVYQWCVVDCQKTI